jgi:hypothetical protein
MKPAQPEPRSDVEAILIRGLRTLLASPANADLIRSEVSSATRSEREAASVGDFATFAPHHVYALSLDPASHRLDLDRARPSAIRFFVGDPAIGPKAIADVELESHGRAVGFESLGRGGIVGALWSAFQTADEIVGDDVTAELRVLEVPEVYVIALWLATDASSSDYFVPIVQTNPELALGKVYESEYFLTIVQQIISRRLESDRGLPA